MGAWFVLILLAVAGAAVTIALVNKYAYGPETDVRDYFQALQDGNGGKALGLLNARVPDSNAALLDGEPLAEASKGLRDVSVHTVTSSGDRAVVRAQYTLNGQEASSEFTLHPAETQWGFFTVWDFDPSTLPTMTVHMPDSTAVDINGTAVALPGASGEFAVFYPGIYTGSYSSTMVRAEPREVAVSDSQERTTMTLKAEPTERLTRQVDQQIHEHLDECAAQDSLYPAGCPFSYQFDGRVKGRVSWDIKTYPAAHLSVDDAAAGRWHVTDSRAIARVEFTAVDLYDGSTSRITDEVPFLLSADVRVTGDEVTLTPR